MWVKEARKKEGRGPQEAKYFILVSPKLTVEVKSFYIKKVYINYMNSNFHKSQNETFCIGQKICMPKQHIIFAQGHWMSWVLLTNEKA